MALSPSIRRPLRRFTQVGHRRRALVAEAVTYLLLARLGLIVVPFPVLARRLGSFVPPSDPRALATRGKTAQAGIAEDVSWAVTLRAVQGGVPAAGDGGAGDGPGARAPRGGQ